MPTFGWYTPGLTRKHVGWEVRGGVGWEIAKTTMKAMFRVAISPTKISYSPRQSGLRDISLILTLGSISGPYLLFGVLHGAY